MKWRTVVGEKIRNNSTIARNTGYLTIIECIRLLLPFVALPYIIRTIGAEFYGMVAFSQAVVQYFSIFINFGFDVSVVRDVALYRNDRETLNRIVSSVLFIKTILFLLMFGILIIGIFVIPFMSEHPMLMLFAFITCASDLLFPIWFFQGIEKMKYITLIRSVSIVFYFFTIFIFVRQKSDYENVALLQSLGNVVAGVISFYCILWIENVKLQIPSFGMVKKMLREALPFWFSRLSSVFINNFAKIASGFFLTMESVAAFDLAQKISNAVCIPTNMMSQAAYPHISRAKNRRFATRFLFLVGGIALVLSILVYILSSFIVQFFSGQDFSEAVSILRVFCLFSFSTSMVSCTGTCVLLAFGHSRPFNMSVILATMVLVVLYLSYYVLGIKSSILFAFVLVVCDLFVLFYRLYYCYKNRLLSFSETS